MGERNFLNNDAISVDSCLEQKVTPVKDELCRGGKLYDERIRLKLRRREVKPLYNETRKEKYELSKIAVYRLFCTFPKSLSPYTTEYPECEHKGNVILNRDVLEQDEHIALLAQPKIRPIPPKMKKRQCHFEKRFLPDCTARIEDLATPRKRTILMTLNAFKGILSPRQVDFLCELLHRDNNELKSIERAVQLRREECKRLRNINAKLLKESTRIKRKLKMVQKQQVKDIVCTIYEVMKEFLMTDHNVELSKGLKHLSEILEWKIREFLGNAVPCELEQGFIKMLAINLAIWMEKFLTNFGFVGFFEQPQPQKQICSCLEQDLHEQLPIDDYIEYPEEEEEVEEEEEEEEEAQEIPKKRKRREEITGEEEEEAVQEEQEEQEE